jgi:hypothetical protein
MGTAQSSEVKAGTATSSSAVAPAKESNKPSADESNLSGWDLINYKCAKKKRRYDKCCSEYYKLFVSGKAEGEQEEMCGEKFEAYKTCILKGMKKEIWDKKGYSRPKEGTMLAEVYGEDEKKS